MDNLLDHLNDQNIQIVVLDNQNLKLLYQKNQMTKELKIQIKKYKKKIIERQKQNEQARSKGFNVYGHGDLYEYRYGFCSFLFIERYSNDLVTAWRANYPKGEDKPYKIKIIRKNSSFERAFRDAVGFIDWLKKRKG